MFKKFDLKKIEQKLTNGQKAQRMFVYTVPQKQVDFVDRTAPVNTCDEKQVEYFCKVLEGCGFSF
ncbi:MAG: hypothetical protein IJV77_07435 [Clostridia bacterium]|nr:hypothetical protein [Clostridia bacterium]